jgi:glycerophosphoryl diester phosphodiesterase
MYALKKLIQNASNLNDGKVFLLTFSDPNLKSLVLSLNKDQLKMGQLADETFLQEYSQRSIDVYGKRPGRFTLYDTGEFYNSFDVLAVTKDAIIEFADTEKPDKDLLEYGEVIGLNGQSLEILINEAIPIMRDKILSELLRGI